ncbi:hypothetical protein OH77DRAFT_536984 [Trametes cingulata]|nr:hypothetical protein OH77DRAFT_536984 [Trametes cingulata]
MRKSSFGNRQATSRSSTHPSSSSVFRVSGDSGASYSTIDLASLPCPSGRPPCAQMMVGKLAPGDDAGGVFLRNHPTPMDNTVNALSTVSPTATTTARFDAIMSDPLDHDSMGSFFLSDASPVSTSASNSHHWTSRTHKNASAATSDARATSCCSPQAVALVPLATVSSDAGSSGSLNMTSIPLGVSDYRAISSSLSTASQASSISGFPGTLGSTSAEGALPCSGTQIYRASRPQWQGMAQRLQSWWSRRGIKEVRRAEGRRVDLLE